MMQRAILQKFRTHGDIRKILLATEDEMIIQEDIGDYYWGTGKDGSGKNYLGQILMDVRSTFCCISRTYAKTPYIAHDNFDELHYSHVRSPNYFYSKTVSAQ